MINRIIFEIVEGKETLALHDDKGNITTTDNVIQFEKNGKNYLTLRDDATGRMIQFRENASIKTPEGIKRWICFFPESQVEVR